MACSSACSTLLALPTHWDLACVTTPIVTTTTVEDVEMDVEDKEEDVAVEAQSTRTKAKVVSTTLMLLPIRTPVHTPSKYHPF
jgi:hypothetical protein